jgi:hypothetical protein
MTAPHRPQPQRATKKRGLLTISPLNLSRRAKIVLSIVLGGVLTQFVIWAIATNSLLPGGDSEPRQSASSSPATTSPVPTPTPTWTPPSPSVTPGSVTALALALPFSQPNQAVYDRDEFGQKWADVDRNGCDQRNDVLRRDMVNLHTKPGTNGCVLQSGVLVANRWSYGGHMIKYKRGNGKIEIDHVVSLADAWRMGAHDWDADKRERFANDFMNLQAVDAATNRAKGDKSAAEWLPEAEPTDICWFIARQVTIKSRYHLAVTQDEKDEMIRGLSSGLCDGNRVKPPSSSKFEAPKPKPIGEPKPKPKPKPSPEPKPTQEPEPEPYYKNCDAVRAAGKDPIHRGDPGYGRHLDRDGDGVGCE